MGNYPPSSSCFIFLIAVWDLHSGHFTFWYCLLNVHVIILFFADLQLCLHYLFLHTALHFNSIICLKWDRHILFILFYRWDCILTFFLSSRGISSPSTRHLVAAWMLSITCIYWFDLCQNSHQVCILASFWLNAVGLGPRPLTAYRPHSN